MSSSSNAGYKPPSLKNDEENQVANEEREEFLKKSSSPAMVVASTPAKLVVKGRIVSPNAQQLPTATAVPAPAQGFNSITTSAATTDLPLQQKRIIFVWFLVATGVYGLLFLMSLAAVVMSAMMFDAGINVGALIGFALVWSFPVLIGWAVKSMWKSYQRRDYRMGLMISTIPAFLLILSLASRYTIRPM